MSDEQTAPTKTTEQQVGDALEQLAITWLQRQAVGENATDVDYDQLVATWYLARQVRHAGGMSAAAQVGGPVMAELIGRTFAGQGNKQ